MRKVCRILLLLAPGLLAAQPAYEVASIKPNISGNVGGSSHETPGQIVITNRSLKRLIERAYDVKPFQVVGPDWIDTLRFDIVAKNPPQRTPDDTALMLRKLLEDRFKLAVHRESKEMPGYALVIAKSGFKLKPVEPGESESDGTPTALVAKKTPMSNLSAFLARRLGEVIVDQTGLDGVYTFELHWTLDPPPNDTASDRAQVLFSAMENAVQQTLGLRLQPKKVPVEMIVVDRAERFPTEN